MERPTGRFGNADALAKLVGKAPAFIEVIREIPAIAMSGAPVLISGETGTGKELVARAVHYSSNRASCSFVAVNCGSMVESLLEAELFGHERGAFTGAVSQRAGMLAEAHEGTLFLDEVDALSGRAQVNLLRVLQEHKYRSVGSSIEREVDVRVVAATNASLDHLLQSRLFRPDLYYRLCVFQMYLPPLRDRKEDIPLLAAHFLKKHSLPHATAPRLAPDALAALVASDWPGNIRELENAIIRGIHLSLHGVIEIADLRLPQCEKIPTASRMPPFKSGKRDAIEAFEREYLTRMMLVCGGNITRAAAAAKKERRDFARLLKKHMLDPKTFRQSAAG